MIKHIHTLLIAGLLLFVASPAFALSLQEAKTQGLVGEQLNGYLGAVKASPEVNQLIKSVNNKRKTKYQAVAKKNGLSLEQVAKLAGSKAISLTKAGNFIQNQKGKRVKK